MAVWSSLHLSRISWSLADQGVVSAGTFLLNVLLVRGLVAEDYGIFALLFGGMLTLQLVNTALVIHPLSVRLVNAASAEVPRLLLASLVLMGLLTLGLAVLLAAIILLLGRPDLVLPSLACFVAWQIQESMRRGLLSAFRFRTAALGDSLSYIGQVVVVAGLSVGGGLTLQAALYGMAATSALAAALQALQLELRITRPLRLAETAADYWSIGGGWALGNGMLLHGRAQLLLWGLAAHAGPAGVAVFQAALNIVNLSNPVMLSLCNIIPPTASQARQGGLAAAWRASRLYAFLAAPPLLAYGIIVVAVPDLMFRLLYGADSPYLEFTMELRLLVLATLLGYAADVVAAFLHGVSAIRLVFFIACIGALTTLVLAVPLIGGFAVIGVCLTHIGANLARLVASWLVLARLIGPTTADLPA